MVGRLLKCAWPNQDLNEFLNLSELVSNLEPDFKTSNDWGKLGTSGLSLIRKVEVKTPFIKQDGTVRSEFSHVLQDFWFSTIL